MKLSVAALATALIFASPTFAATPQKPAAEKCVTLDAAAKTLAKDDVRVERKYVGDELKKFNDNAKKVGLLTGDVPEGLDGVLVVSKPGMHFWAALAQKHGCIFNIFPITKEAIEKIEAGDDGSI